MQNSTQTAEQTIPEAANLLKLNPREEHNFWRRVNKNGPIPEHRPELGACWMWIGNLTKTGYGQFSLRKKTKLAHRLSWEIHFGEIIRTDNSFHGTCVLHKCDNGACVNPDHLFLGTQIDNIKDMVSKNRQSTARGDSNYMRHHPDIAQGENNGNSKLTAEDVKELRRIRQANGTACTKLAIMFGINASTVMKIIKRENWIHVK